MKKDYVAENERTLATYPVGSWFKYKGTLGDAYGTVEAYKEVILKPDKNGYTVLLEVVGRWKTTGLQLQFSSRSRKFGPVLDRESPKRVDVSMFSCDWQKFWTAAEAEEQLRDFKFKGPGWYHTTFNKANHLTMRDTLLVVPEGEVSNPWVQTWPPGQVFCFMVYNNRNPVASFNAVVNAPTRQDED